MKPERLGITMLINDKSRLKRNVEQIGFQITYLLTYLCRTVSVKKLPLCNAAAVIMVLLPYYSAKYDCIIWPTIQTE